MSYAIDLEPFYEATDIKPALQNAILRSGDKLFKVDRWFKGDKHCYVLIHQAEIAHRPRPKKPSELKLLLDNGTLKMENNAILWPLSQARSFAA